MFPKSPCSPHLIALFLCSFVQPRGPKRESERIKRTVPASHLSAKLACPHKAHRIPQSVNKSGLTHPDPGNSSDEVTVVHVAASSLIPVSLGAEVSKRSSFHRHL